MEVLSENLRSRPANPEDRDVRRARARGVFLLPIFSLHKQRKVTRSRSERNNLERLLFAPEAGSNPLENENSYPCSHPNQQGRSKQRHKSYTNMDSWTCVIEESLSITVQELF